MCSRTYVTSQRFQKPYSSQCLKSLPPQACVRLLTFVQVLPHQSFFSFLCMRIKQKCQWKFYIKGFLYTSLEWLQFCIVRPFHTQTSRIAHTHTQPTHTHNLKRALTLSTVPSIHVRISEKNFSSSFICIRCTR